MSAKLFAVAGDETCKFIEFLINEHISKSILSTKYRTSLTFLLFLDFRKLRINLSKTVITPLVFVFQQKHLSSKTINPISKFRTRNRWLRTLAQTRTGY